MKTIRIYNTLSQKKEIFNPINSGKVGIYSCGPTIYDYSHIGNYRSFIFSDVLHRVFRHFGYQVKLVMNLTDIDDKTIQGSIQKKKTLSDYTQIYEKVFFEDLQTLNFLPAYRYPKATKHIPQMVNMIQSLQEKGHAYKVNGSIYFKINSFPEYGKLSKIQIQEQLAGAGGRVDSDEYDKENVSDFVLWKNYHPNDGEVFYNTALGKGRPGWHIECSAMSKEYLGEHFDIHTGGIDNRFPHHENEIAQSECAHRHSFVNYWMHVSHLLVEGEKMSKSAGNFYTLRDLLEKNIHPLTLRYMMVSVHYRNQYNFTREGIEAADKALERIRNFLEVWHRIKSKEKVSSFNPDNGNDSILDEKKQHFFECLSDDINVSGALGAFFEYLSQAHKILHSSKPKEKLKLDSMMEFLKEVDDCLGIIPFTDNNKGTDVPTNLTKLLKERDQARREKNFAEADRIRDFISGQGYIIIDTPSGSELKKN